MLERPIQDRVVEGLRELSENPYKGKLLKGKLKGMWSFRIGKYRILYQIQDEKLMLFVIDVEHRKHVYEK
ncbi:ParE toxin of type II toxin-antitoxin system, parDE [uncultured archaeon]|nr:ParE toxin of type II toxin-antitoxin system, parDE [uncultured archaeon]